MTEQHPITPPPELVAQWVEYAGLVGINEYQLIHLATQAARWGSDQELEACCEWLANARNHTLSWNEATNYSANLRHARRPKPPSLKEQAKFAAAVLRSPDETCSIAELQQHWHTICNALESLPD